MGIRQLQTFMQNTVPNGYLTVSLHDECESFKRRNNVQPILLIDLMGFLRPMVKDKKEMLCGLRQNEIYKSFDQLLLKLSRIAELVFYLDGPVNNLKVEEWTKRQNIKYENCIKILDLIKQNYSLDDILRNIEEIPSVTSHLHITECLAIKYGSLKTSFYRECDAEMAQFASKNSRVLAIIADDSDFLIYPGNWKYFSLGQLDQDKLVTKEYNRRALREFLQLNDRQLVLLSTLNGNDVIPFEDTYHFHKSLIQQRNNPAIRFPAIADFINKSQILQSHNCYRNIAYLIYNNNNKNCVEKIRNSFEFYSIDFEIPEIRGEIYKFCVENSNNFLFAILKNIPKSVTVQFFDLRENVHHTDHFIKILQKQIGIVDPKLKRIELRCKMSHKNTYKSIYVNPIIPTIPQPPLIQLLDRAKYPQHDKIRFDLLKWTISEEKFKNVNLMEIPVRNLSDILVLVWMVSRGYISPFEADIILLTVKHTDLNIIPEDTTIPEYLHPRAFVISFLFSKVYNYVAKSLQVTGLKGLLKVNIFDGVLFHNIYLKSLQSPFNMSSLLGDYTKYRYYM